MMPDAGADEFETPKRVECPLRCGQCVLLKNSYCGFFHFEYGCIHMTLDTEGFLSFARVIERLSSNDEKEEKQKFYLQLAGLNMKLVFHLEELRELHRMMQHGKMWLRGAALKEQMSKVN